MGLAFRMYVSWLTFRGILMHGVVRQDEGQFSLIPSRAFPSIEELVSYYQKQIRSDKRALGQPLRNSEKGRQLTKPTVLKTAKLPKGPKTYIPEPDTSYSKFGNKFDETGYYEEKDSEEEDTYDVIQIDKTSSEEEDYDDDPYDHVIPISKIFCLPKHDNLRSSRRRSWLSKSPWTKTKPLY